MTKLDDNISKIESVLKSNGLQYRLEDSSFLIPFTGNNGTTFFQIVMVTKNSATFYTGIFDGVKEDRIRDISQKFMRLNSELIYGAYLVDPQSKKVVFKTSTYRDNGKLNRKDLSFHHRFGVFMISNLDKHLEERDIPPITFDRTVPDGPMYS